MFITVLFTIAKKWKQLKCPSAFEWINKVLYVHAMEYYLAIKGINYYICYNMDET